MGDVLVLNFDYTPLNVTTIRRGFVLVDKGKAEIVKSDDTPIVAGYNTYVRPVIIRLLKYIKHFARNLRANRNRIYKRDNHQCVYCGSSKHLTLDHVIPKSRGGKNDWHNLVTSCFKCNLKKSNRTPEEAKMAMRHKPYAKMNSKTSLRIALVISSLFLIWSLIMMDKYKKLSDKASIEILGGGDISKSQTIDSLQHLVDSLHDENYPCQIELNRFQIAYKIFLERNPKAASQYGDIISNETE